MAQPVIPPRAKLFIGVLAGNDGLLLRAEEALVKKYGEIDNKSQRIPFEHTDYYSGMGKDLFKVFLSFRKLIKREDIAEIKLHTNSLEKRISGKAGRVINIDPGYLTLSNVFLASCKEYFHRVYLGGGVYLENEYRFVAKRFQPWDWTYPDYRKWEYLDFFHKTRDLYYRQLRAR